MQYLLLISGWGVYFFFHSLLASTSFKEKYAFKGYRVAYTVLSGAGLLLLLFYNGSIDTAPFFVSEGFPRYISLMMTTFGVMIIQSSFRQYSFRGFIGLKAEEDQLSTTGILKYIRHPIYAGTILIILGLFVFIPNLATLTSCICMLIYIPIGIMLEEKKLVARYGAAYIQYRNDVPALLPKLA
jgi:protein-S-isoprenylcysteine O-methyltransferase Ste14